MGLSRADLRAVNVDRAEMCLLLSATAEGGTKSMLLADKDAILTTLTIKAMNFGVLDAFDDAPLAPPTGHRYRSATNTSANSACKSQTRSFPDFFCTVFQGIRNLVIFRSCA